MFVDREFASKFEQLFVGLPVYVLGICLSHVQMEQDPIHSTKWPSWGAVLCAHLTLTLKILTCTDDLICREDDFQHIKGEATTETSTTASDARLFTLTFTSGSTGSPKGAMVTEASWLR